MAPAHRRREARAPYAHIANSAETSLRPRLARRVLGPRRRASDPPRRRESRPETVREPTRHHISLPDVQSTACSDPSRRRVRVFLRPRPRRCGFQQPCAGTGFQPRSAPPRGRAGITPAHSRRSPQSPGRRPVLLSSVKVLNLPSQPALRLPRPAAGCPGRPAPLPARDGGAAGGAQPRCPRRRLSP